MQAYLNIAQIVVAIALIIAVLLQVRGGGLGGIFGTQTGMYRTRRGVEKTLFRFTIILVLIFIVISIFALRIAG
ncbi:MAG: preprotein translocase subunit SecG [Dehalococcoidia bacterium]|nr:MAG: preprotein translocase subunit SecG [Dehalococcoidia bacterium]